MLQENSLVVNKNEEKTVISNKSFKIVKRPMDKTCNPWEQDDRWVIVDFRTGNIIDDAQGYGYKSPQKAAKAGWWKFKGGKIRTNNEEKIVKLWMSNNAKYVEEYENIVICNFKDLPSKNELVEMLYLKTGIRIPSTSYFKYFT